MIDKTVKWAAAYIELGIEFLMSHLLTIEGVIALLLGVFFVGLIASLRN